jgi:YbbR domain-containing protein
MDKFLRSNNFARFLALFLAIILWLFVTGDKITRTTPSLKVWQDVPLRVENLNQDYVVTEIPEAVDITLEGLPDAFAELPIQEIDAFVDLSGKEPGNHLVRVQGRPPRGLSLVLIEPEQVRIVIEAYFSEDFPVEIEFLGEPATGWELDTYSVLPEVVLVGAPESIFEQINQVKLLIDLTDMLLVESTELEPIAYDEEGNLVRGIAVDPSLVTVRLEFTRIVEPEEENENISFKTIHDLNL